MKFLKMRLKIFFFFVFNSVVPCSDVGTDLATCIYLYQVSLYSLAPDHHFIKDICGVPCRRSI